MDSVKERIVIASCHPSSKGGISTWVKQLQKRIGDDNRLEVEYIYPAFNEKKKINATERSVFNRIFGSLILMKRRLKEFKQCIVSFKPDVLHLTTSGSLSLFRDICFLRIAKKNAISTTYHIRFGRIPEIAKNGGWEWKLLKRAIFLSDSIIAIDHKTEESLVSHFPQKEIVYIPNFINTLVTENVEIEKQKKIVFVGWCVKTKGVEELLRAWESLSKTFPEYKLQLIGPITDDYKHYLVNHFFLENVELIGEQSHKDTLNSIGSASIFILPSYTEGFPNVVLEAMSLGKPVIATDVGAIPDMLEGCGVVIQSHDQSAIYSSLYQLIEDERLRDTLGVLARRKVYENYSIDIVYEQYYSLWKGLRKVSK